MKLIILFFFLSFFKVATAQNDYPKIIKTRIEDKIFHGEINRNPITIYLKFHQYSNYHLGVYSVNGWYYFDSVKEKIPLVGIVEYNEFVLYNYVDSTKANNILCLPILYDNHWKDLKFYKSKTDFDERIIVNNSVSTWSNKEVTYSLQLNQPSFDILSENEFIYFDSTHVFDLKNFKRTGFRIVKYLENTFILEFIEPSRLYAMGNCGAGLERGLIHVEYDESYNLLNFNEFLINSCNDFIDLMSVKNSSKDVFEYNYENYETHKKYKLKVNLNTLEITLENSL